MPLKDLRLSPLYPVPLERLAPEYLSPGTLTGLLAQSRPLWFPTWVAAQWRGQAPTGASAWPAPVLLGVLILRWSEEGMSRRAAVERVNRDLSWRVALGIPLGQRGPSDRTVRDFEAFLRQRDCQIGLPRYLLVFEHVVRQCLHQGVLDPAKAVCATDSTPMWCYGAVQDTVRRMGEGLMRLGRKWAQALKEPVEQVAARWNQPLLLANSVKGYYAIDWRDREARHQLIDELAQQVLGAVDRVRRGIQQVRPSQRKALLRACRHLVRVIQDDLETDEHGRLVIAQRVAKDRLISLTDPQARHGRKSERDTFDGFKVHLVGDLVSGLLLSLCVTQGNTHDGVPAHRLLRRAKALYQDLVQVLADTAYGGARLRYLVRGNLGVSLLSPPPPQTHGKDRLGRQAIQLDLQVGTATCANGHTTQDLRLVWSGDHQLHVRKFKWPKPLCDACPLSEACRGKQTGGHVVLLHPYEPELREAREMFARPQVRQMYRTRTQAERLVGQVTRHGGRRARAFGLGAAQLQVHCIALAVNLKLLAVHLARPTRGSPTPALH